MIRYLINNKSPLFWLIFHAVLGGLSIITPFILIAWVYLVFLTSLPSCFRKSGVKVFCLTGLIVYVVSFELLGRMSGTSPFIPYEMGKYLLFVFLITGVFAGYRNGRVGWGLLFLLVPAALIDESGQVWFKNIVFNLLGPVNVALAVIFFREQAIDREELLSLLRLLALPAISVLTFVIIKVPDLENIEFTLGANFKTAGGFGSNQVSTVLGLGAFLSYIFWRNRWNLSGYRWLDLALLILFTLRGLLTFSRGGMIGGALGLLVLILYEITAGTYEWNTKRAFINFVKITPIILLFFIVFKYSDEISGGKLVLRYQGETPGTAGGYREKTLNTFTANRFNVFIDDLKLWREHPLLGVGVGASSYLRENTRRVAAHVELSRLLSEHGLFGLAYFFVLCVLGYKVFRRASGTVFSHVLFAMFILALFTTFHSAMRTFITPLLMGLSMLTISDQEETVE